MSQLIVQGNGHVEFDDGFRCALYIDNDNNLYATAELMPIDLMISLHGNYVPI